MAAQTKQKNDFLLQGGILAVASLLVRVIGMIYRIFMTKIIGSQGIGYYSAAFQVYNIMLLLSSYSLPLAVSRMVSARLSVEKWRETKKLLTVSLLFAFGVGLFFGLVTYFGADFFCTIVISNEYAAIALKWMAPTVFIMGVLGVLRGFYQGLNTTVPTAVSQIIEQVANALVSVGMAALLFQHGKELEAISGIQAYPYAWGAAGGTIGTGIGALAALIFFLVIFLRDLPSFGKNVKNDIHQRSKKPSKLLQLLVETAVPIMLSTVVLDCLGFIDMAMFNHCLEGQGIAEVARNQIWGDYENAYLTIVRLPVSLVTALGAALVPALAAAFEQKDGETVHSRIDLTLRVTFVLSIPVGFGFTVLGGNLAKLFFGSSMVPEAQGYLVVGGLGVLFCSLATVTNAILHGLNDMKRPLFHSLIALVVHLAVLALLLFVFKLNIYAVIVCYVLFNIVLTVLNLRAINKATGYEINAMQMILYPCVAAIVMTIVCLGLSFLLSRVMSGTWMHLMIILVGLVVGAAIYFVIVFKAGCITKKQIRQLPYGKKLSKIPEKLHLYRE